MAIGGALFGLLSARMSWLSHRQGLLTQNVANADTPGYVPRDLSEAAFARLVDRSAAARRGAGAGVGAEIGARGPVALARTDAGHRAAGAPATIRLAAAGRPQEATFEEAPNGNAVVLEEQMAAMAHTALDHRLAADLYRKYVGMVRVALGGSGA